MILLLVIISLALLVLVHELGHFFAAKACGVSVEEFGFGFPPRLIAKKIGKTVYSLNLFPLGGFVKIFGENGAEASEQKNETSFSSKPVWKRSVIVLAGIASNILLAWIIIIIIFTIGVPKHLIISDIAPDSPAEQVGLKSGDIILEAKINRENLKDPIVSEIFVELIKKESSTIHLSIQRGEEVLEKEITPRINPPEGEGALGVNLIEIGFDKSPFPKNILEGTKSTIENIRLIGGGILTLIAGLFGKTDVLSQVTGLVGIFQVANETGKMGAIYLAQLMALISLNLAILNLIPFPALDGGRFIFLLIEKITRRNISHKVQAITNATGFLALVLLMIIVTVKDLGLLK